MRKKGLIKPFHTFTCFGTILILLSSCIAKNDVAIKLKNPKKKETFTDLPPVTVSNVQVVNHQIIITGTNLSSVSQFQVKDGSTNTNLQIESKTATTIVANTISNVTFAAGKILDFIFTNAEASATFTVNFSLCDSTLGGKSFNCTLTPNDKEVLSYDAASGKWQPRAVNGLSYIGTFDASGGGNPSAKPAGNYYIISVAGDIDGGATILGIGDWIVSNGTSWQKIDNSTAITSVHSRTGAVIGAEGDYDLTQLSDVTIATPITNQILKYDGTKWVNSDLSALGGGTVTSVSGTAPIAVTNGTSTPTISISQATTSTNGYLSSTDWNTFNNKQPAITAGTTAQYYRGDKSWQTLDTLAVPENTNLYFTNARVLGVPLTGFSATNSAIAATDTILQAFGKAQGQIDNLTSGGSNYIVKNGVDTVTGVVNFNTVGALSIGYTPTNLTDATSKSYVDSTVSTSAALKVNKAGDTMTGDLQLNTNLKFKDTGSNTASLQAPTSIGTSYVLRLPAALGANNQVLTTDASGNLSWTTPATSAAPNGSAGGELAGTYPNPTIAANAITDSHIAANAISQSKINGLTTALSGKEPAIAAGATTQYIRGDKTLSTFADDVLATLLAGLSTATNAVISATDSTLIAFGKLQAQITGQATTLSNKADRTNVSQTITAATVTGLSAPLVGSDAVNKAYVDGLGQWSKGTGANASDIYFSTGNVGIGTNTPGTKLAVTGDAKISGPAAFGNYAAVGSGCPLCDDLAWGWSPKTGVQIVNKVTAIPTDGYENILNYAEVDPTADNAQVWLIDNYVIDKVTTTKSFDILRAGHFGADHQGSGNVTMLSGLHSMASDYGSGTVTNIQGGSFAAIKDGTGVVTNNNALSGNAINKTASALTNSHGVLGGVNNNSTGTIGYAVGTDGLVKNNDAGTITIAKGLYGDVTNTQAGTIGNALGADLYILNAGAGPITQATGVNVGIENTGSGTIPNAYGSIIKIQNTGTGSITNAYGINIPTIQATGNKFAIHAGDTGATSYFAGKVGVGIATPSQKFSIAGTSVSGSAGQTNISAFSANGMNIAGSIANAAQDAITYASGGGGGAAIAFRRGAGHDTYLDFYTNSALTAGAISKAMTITNSGTVGIGVDVPITKFEVNGGISTKGGEIIMQRPTGGGGWARGLHYTPDGSYNATADGLAGIGVYGTGTTQSDIYLAFGAAPWGSSVGMHIFSNGNVAIGSTTASYKLDVNGTIRGFGITDSSDMRLKKEIKPLEDDLEKIKKIQGVSYRWKNEKDHGDKKQIGLIAQAVEKIYPELVATDKVGMKSVNYSHFVAPIIESVKSLAFKVEQLFTSDEKQNREIASIKATYEIQINNLENKNNELQSDNEMMKRYLCKKDPKAPFCLRN